MQDNKILLQKIFQEGIKQVMPSGALQRRLRLATQQDVLWVGDTSYPLQGKKILLLGAGKGVGAMAKAMEDILGERISDGLVVTKYEHTVPLRFVKIMQAGHPIPDENGVLATTEMLAKAEKADADTLLICLLTGGGSALTPAPAQGLNLLQIQQVTSELLRSGASIDEVNAIRKHLSIFSGGQLARIAQPATVLTLIISDVIGDSLDVIASGPTAADASTFQDCTAILKKYAIDSQIPKAVAERLHQGVAGNIAETPKATDAIFANVNNKIVATNKDALKAMAEYVQNLTGQRHPSGFEVQIMDKPMQGEARKMAHTLIDKAKKLQAHLTREHKPICLIAGGETTVSIRGTGKGGRNQEMALTAAIALDGHHGIYTLFAGTDGTDGPTDANGGFADGNSAQKMRVHCDPEELLINNDSNAALLASNEIFITGPTLTNVMDVAILLIFPAIDL